MVKKERTLASSDGRTALHVVEWMPEGEIRAVVQIAHGIAEYVLRYEPFAAFLTGRGFAVVGNDHLGHGGSQVPGEPRLHFGEPGGWRHVVDDLYALRDETGRRFHGVPYFLLGHSMGSFLARTYLIRYPGSVDGAVLVGTGHMPAAMSAAGSLVAAAEMRRLGGRAMSPLVTRLSFETYNKMFAPNRTGYDWLSADPDNVDAYISDPLCGGNAAIGTFREMMGGIRFITKQSNIEKMNRNVPVLFVSGCMDPVGECGKGVERACRSFRRAGVRDVTMKLYPNARHEILNDDCKELVFRDVGQWLEAHMPPS